MKAKLEKLAKLYIYLKSRKVIKQINTMLDFPVKSKEIKKVLIILPRELTHLDDATQFIQELRKSYKYWKIEIIDVDKIDDLNLLNIPDQKIIEKIRNTNYHLVIDLNEQFDLVCAFIAIMSEANYRMTFNSKDQNYFNMQCHPADIKNGFFYQSLFDNLQKLFTKN
jgi:hypothetical protein